VVLPVRYAQVHGLRMAYREAGAGDPVVLLHGNPTSSYLWRDVVGRVAEHGRRIAPDLVGMGASDEVPGAGPGSYRFVEHRRYLDGLLDALGVHGGSCSWDTAGAGCWPWTTGRPARGADRR
jgi:haloalkane dehalogenase